MIDSNTFINALIRDVRSALPDSDKVRISVRSDSAELTTTRATALGALLLELINNALKHAFPEGMKGTITLTFTTSSNKYVVEFEDNGVGIKQEQTGGFGTQSLIGLTRLMGGSITCQPASKSSTRPGTLWRLVIPA